MAAKAVGSTVKADPQEMRVRLTFIEPVLGAAPSDEEVYSTYIASKAPDAPTKQDEIENFGVDEVEKKAMTVFPRLNDKAKTPYLYDYQIKGMFKNACSMLKKVTGSESSKITAVKKEIGCLVFINERRIPFQNYGEISNFQRPLRASTMQGERIALANSEMIKEGATVEFTVKCLVPSMMKAVCEWLDYGQLNGLLQFHNGGFGRFKWEDISSKSDDEPKKRGRKAAAKEEEVVTETPKRKGRPKKAV